MDYSCHGPAQHPPLIVSPQTLPMGLISLPPFLFALLEFSSTKELAKLDIK